MSNTAVITFGRMNPITVGHQKLIQKVESLARLCNAEPLLYLSHSCGTDRNPLDYMTRYLLAKQAFPKVNVQWSESRTIIQILKELADNFDDIIYVAGSDRLSEFDNLLNKYNHTDYSFESITVASAGVRDADSTDVDGMSSTKMREYAKNGDNDRFTLGLPSGIQPMSTHIMNLIRKEIL